MRITDQNITDQQARKLAMFERVNAKIRARKAGLQVVEINGALVAGVKTASFNLSLTLWGPKKMIVQQEKLKDLKAGQFFFFDSNLPQPFKNWFRVSWLEGDGISEEPRRQRLFKVLFQRVRI